MDVGPAIPSLARARPVPTSIATAPQVLALGNIHVERSLPTPCGTRTPDRLVLCLNADSAFAPADELALLARASAAVLIEVGSVKARDAVLRALSAADTVAPLDPTVTAFADCIGACDGRVVIGSRK